MLYLFGAKYAIPQAPGPACTPTVLPIILIGELDKLKAFSMKGLNASNDSGEPL